MTWAKKWHLCDKGLKETLACKGQKRHQCKASKKIFKCDLVDTCVTRVKRDHCVTRKRRDTSVTRKRRDTSVTMEKEKH